MHDSSEIIKTDIYLKNGEKAYLWFSLHEKNSVSLSISERENENICDEISKNLYEAYKKSIL